MLSSIRKRMLDGSILATYSEAMKEVQESPLTGGVPWRVVNSEGKEVRVPSYLDLRRQQNEAWAEDRLVEGVALAKSRDFQKAEECYQQGLEIHPDHSNLLTAYGALLANKGDKRKAIELLDKALRVDPDHEQAKIYRDKILMRKPAADSKPPPNATERDDQGEDQSMDPVMQIKPSKEDPGTRGYSLVEENVPSDDSSTSSRAAQKRKKRSRKRRRRKSNNSDDSNSSSDESESERRRRRRRKKEKKKRRKKRKEKKRRRREEAGSSDGEDSDGSNADLKAKVDMELATKTTEQKA